LENHQDSDKYRVTTGGLQGMTAVMLVLGLGPGLKDSLRTRTKSLVLALRSLLTSLDDCID